MSKLKVFVTGGYGFLGRYVCRALEDAEHSFHCLPRSLGDLRNPEEVARIGWSLYDAVIHLAYPGGDGIGTMLEKPGTLTADLLRMDTNVIQACAEASPQPRLITIGSVCSYPARLDHFPTAEWELWSGAPEAVNGPYGNAKRMQWSLLEAYRREAGLKSIQLVMANLYGPGDASNHVIPATIRKCLKARWEGAKEVVIWGDGTPTRSFLHVEDAARAVVLAAEASADPGMTSLAEQGGVPAFNICASQELSVRYLAQVIAGMAGFDGPLMFDTTKPNGAPRRLFSNANAKRALGWQPRVPFEWGLQKTVEWMVARGEGIPWREEGANAAG